MSKTYFRTGITTGASAAAAARAAVGLLFHGARAKQVTVVNPQGQLINVPIASLENTRDGARAVVIKDGGDDPDVTHGLPVVVEARRAKCGIFIRGGTGVGKVTRPGLAVPVGEPAVNPVPRQMITSTVAEIIPAGQGVELTISVPGGEKVAARTLNPRLGIVGGISILGTTGIVRPMSEEAFKNSLVPLVDMAKAAGYSCLLLTPGGMGARMAVEQYGFPEEAVVEMSNFVGFMLETCVQKGVTQVLLWGHHGKLVKVSAGIFHTHSRIADGRRETLACYTALLGGDRELIVRILEATTLESVVEILAKHNLLIVYDYLARQASRRAEEFVHGQLKVGTVMLGLDGRILGLDEQARIIGRTLGCRGLK